MLAPTPFVALLILTVQGKSPLALRILNVIGPQLRRVRNERDVSQPALAASCQREGWDVSRDTLANIEGQRRWVTDFELLLLARVLAVSVDALMPTATVAPRAIKSALGSKPVRREHQKGARAKRAAGGAKKREPAAARLKPGK